MSTATEKAAAALANEQKVAKIVADAKTRREGMLREASKQRLIDKRDAYLREIAIANDLVERKKAPENVATYAKAMSLRPVDGVYPISTKGGCSGGECACIDIEEYRRQSGRYPARPKNFDVRGHCRKKAAKVGKKKGLMGALQSLGKAVKTVGKALKSVENAIVSIPVIGTLAEIAASPITEPFRLSIAIARGDNVGDALVAHWKREFQNVKKAAPYIKAVIGFIPGIGTAAAAALGVGLALLEGQPITQALISGMEAAIPGGVLMRTAFNVGRAIVSGAPLEQIGIAAIPGLPDVAKKALATGAALIRALAKGEKVVDAVFKAAMSYSKELLALGLAGCKKLGLDKVADKVMKAAHNAIPPKIRDEFGKILSAGVAVAHGKNLQAITSKVLESKPFIEKTIATGKALIVANEKIATAYNFLENNAAVRKGFQVGAGLLNAPMHSTGYLKAREVLTPDERKGFDMAAAIQIGMAEDKNLQKAGVKTTRPATSVKTQVGSLLTRGMAYQSGPQKVALMKVVAANPEARAGAVVTIKQIAKERQIYGDKMSNADRRNLLEKMLIAFGLMADDSKPMTAPHIGTAKPVMTSTAMVLA